MHRFFITSDQMQDGRVSFSDDQAQQIQKVLRLRPGQQVMVLDNAGWAYQVELVRVSRKETAGEVLERQPASGEPAVAVTLYQSVIKWDRFEWVLQKGTEMGVTRFVPVISGRSRLKANDTINPNKVARWQRIIVEAAEQSRRGRLPELAPAVNLAEAMAMREAEAALIPWEEAEGGITIGTALASRRPRSVALFIGPEGGFSEDEVVAGRQHGIMPVSLGRRILRAETAAVVAAALVLHEIGEM